MKSRIVKSPTVPQARVLRERSSSMKHTSMPLGQTDYVPGRRAEERHIQVPAKHAHLVPISSKQTAANQSCPETSRLPARLEKHCTLRFLPFSPFQT